MDAHGPLRAFRDRYVATFSGVSYDLAPGAIGIHPENLAQVPELEGRRVLVTRRGLPPRVARPFVVVSVTRLMRNALQLVREGGVVFSSFDLEDPEGNRVLGGLEWGESVFLNSAIDRLPSPSVKRPPSAA